MDLALPSRSRHKWKWRLVLFAPACLAIVTALQATGQQAEPLVILLQGRVIDDETGRPVPSVEVRIHRELAYIDPFEFPDSSRDEAIKTDMMGRFKVRFSSEDVADQWLRASIHLDHPAYTPMETWAFSAQWLDHFRQLGGHPSLGIVRLSRRHDYTARVKTPEGRPAPDVPFRITQDSSRKSALSFAPSTCIGRTDREGVIHSWLASSNRSQIQLTPSDASPLGMQWVFQESDGKPNEFGAIPDITLDTGRRIRGLLINLNGRPPGRQWLQSTNIHTGHRERTRTRDDGSFEFRPQSEGMYIIHGDRQLRFSSPSLPGLDHRASIIEPVIAVVKKDEDPPLISIREAATKIVEFRQIDASGRPFVGDAIEVHGSFPADPTRIFANLPRNAFEPDEGDLNALAAMLSRDWVAVLRPDAEGKLRFRVPAKLMWCGFSLADEGIPGFSCQRRSGLTSWPVAYESVDLMGEPPPAIEIVYAPAPVLKVRLVSKTREISPDDSAMLQWHRRGTPETLSMERLEVGLFTSFRLCNDVEYTLVVFDRQGHSFSVPAIKLSPGTVREMTIDLDQLKPTNDLQEAAPDDDVEEANAPQSSRNRIAIR